MPCTTSSNPTSAMFSSTTPPRPKRDMVSHSLLISTPGKSLLDLLYCTTLVSNSQLNKTPAPKKKDSMNSQLWMKLPRLLILMNMNVTNTSIRTGTFDLQMNRSIRSDITRNVTWMNWTKTYTTVTRRLYIQIMFRRGILTALNQPAKIGIVIMRMYRTNNSDIVSKHYIWIR